MAHSLSWTENYPDALNKWMSGGSPGVFRTPFRSSPLLAHTFLYYTQLHISIIACKCPLLSCVSVQLEAAVLLSLPLPPPAPLVRTHRSRGWASRWARCPGAACCPRAESCRSAAAWRAGICWRCSPRRHPMTGTPAGRDSGTSLRKAALSPEWTWGCIWSQWSGKSWTGSPGDPYLEQWTCYNMNPSMSYRSMRRTLRSYLKKKKLY